MNNLCGNSLTNIIAENQNLIYASTKNYSQHLKEDLFQVGAMGMIDAYRHYNPNMNTKFTTYAYPYVMGEIKKFIRQERNIKVSRDVIYLCSRIEKAKDMLRQVLLKEPTITELSSFLEIEESKIVEALQLNNYVKSIDDPINSEGRELTIKDVIGINEQYDRLDLIWLREELNKLSLIEKEILEKRYLEELTQCEIASMLGISQVEVSRTERKLIMRLRKKMH